MKSAKPHKEGGFTIVELMIATVVFSMVLLICSFAVIHIGRVYYRGLILNRTQDTARRVADDITRSVQYSNGVSDIEGPVSDLDNNNINHLCIGQNRYTYFNFSEGESVAQGSTGHPHVLVKTVKRTSDEGCNDRDAVPSISNDDVYPADNIRNDSATSLLGNNMRLVDFSVNYTGEGLTGVNLTISYGDDEDLFEEGSNFSICRGVNAGGQFCAVSSINTNIKGRL